MLIGFAGFLRRCEIVGLDIGRRDQTEDGRGWIEIFDMDMVVTLRGKTGRRELEIGQGSSDAARRVVALQNWLTLARIGHGPVFRRVKVKGKDVGPDRLADKHVARLVKGLLWPPAYGLTDLGASVPTSSPAIYCWPASPPRPKSTSAMGKK